MIYCVTKATLIHFTTGKYKYKATENRKSHKTCLTNHTGSISHPITSLVMLSGAYTHADTDTHTCIHHHDHISSENYKILGLLHHTFSKSSAKNHFTYHL